MFKKTKTAPAADANPGESAESRLLAQDEAELRYDQDDDDSGEGSIEETAGYIADMIGALAVMAGEARLDLLTYLLNMARVEAELQGRRSEETGEDF